MTHTPTPEEFLAQTETDEADLPDPLESIAGSLRTFVTLLEKHEAAESAEEQALTDYDELEEAYRSLEAQHDATQGLLDQVLAICKPSTSKLANSIRAVLDPEPAADVAEDAAGNVDDSITEPHRYVDTARALCALCDHPAGNARHDWTQAPPADDAPVEVWREFGRQMGLDLTDNLNRSQIRSALGIPQPVTS